MYYKLQTFDLGFLKILNCGGVDVKKKDETKIFFYSLLIKWYLL